MISINSLVVLENNKLLSGSDDSTIILWDLNTYSFLRSYTSEMSGARLRSLLGLPGNFLSRSIRNLFLNFTTKLIQKLDGRFADTTTWDVGFESHGVTRIWDAENMRILKTLKKTNEFRQVLCLLNDEVTLAVNGVKATIELWNLDTSKNVLTLKGNDPHHDIQFLVKLPDNRLATGSYSNHIIIWE